MHPPVGAIIHGPMPIYGRKRKKQRTSATDADASCPTNADKKPMRKSKKPRTDKKPMRKSKKPRTDICCSIVEAPREQKTPAWAEACGGPAMPQWG